VKTRTTHHF